jgi:TP53 regulating kinase and related kinases
MEKIITRGAEAIIILKNKNIIKKRQEKRYRFHILDEKIRRQRTKKEAKLLEKANEIIPVPKILKLGTYYIELERIRGEKLSIELDKLKDSLKVCKQIGVNIAKLHDKNIIHGDLTTSNMIYSKNKLYFIDFGLGFESNRIEDKAVDLHLIKEAFKARHFNKSEIYFNKILEGYEISKSFSEIIKKIENIEKRGRYKS